MRTFPRLTACVAVAIALSAFGCDTGASDYDFTAGEAPAVSLLQRYVGTHTAKNLHYLGPVPGATQNQHIESATYDCEVTIGNTINGNLFVTMASSVANMSITIDKQTVKQPNSWLTSGVVSMNGQAPVAGELMLMPNKAGSIRELYIGYERLFPPSPNGYARLGCWDYAPTM
jgi:hypothetical protein